MAREVAVKDGIGRVSVQLHDAHSRSEQMETIGSITAGVGILGHQLIAPEVPNLIPCAGDHK